MQDCPASPPKDHSPTDSLSCVFVSFKVTCLYENRKFEAVATMEQLLLFFFALIVFVGHLLVGFL